MNIDAGSGDRAEQVVAADVCDGWRADRRCTGPDGVRLLHPHPACLRTSYLERLDDIGRLA